MALIDFVHKLKTFVPHPNMVIKDQTEFQHRVLLSWRDELAELRVSAKAEIDCLQNKPLNYFSFGKDCLEISLEYR